MVDACSDGTESFQVTGPNGYSPVRDCAWVRSGAKKLTAARCEKHDIVRETCPLTCGESACFDLSGTL